MADVLSEVIDDLEAEQAGLASVLDRMPDEAWERKSHAPGWMARDQVAHLATFDETAALAIADADAFRESAKATTDPSVSFEQRYLDKGRAMSHAELRAWWGRASSDLIAAARTMDGKARLPWYGPDMSGVSFITARLMETWSHGLDVVDVAGVDRPDTDRLRHVAFLGVRTRPFSYINRGMQPNTEPVRVELTAPSGAVWMLGEESTTNIIRGTATDFCRVVTQRRHISDTRLEVIGPAAEEWMSVAQAFAGPPGPGRKPGEFAGELIHPMSDELVHLEIKNGVATITLDSPANRNALSRQLTTELEGHVKAAIADPAARVIVLTGSATVFCSGADLKEQRVANETQAAGQVGPGGLVQILKDLWRSPKPVIGRINGAARAGGLGLVAACDLAVAVETASFAVSEVRIGVIPAIISVLLVPKLGEANAMELFITGEPFDAKRAVEVGLLTATAPAEGLDDAVGRYISMILKGAPGAVAGAKQLVRDIPGMEMDAAFAAMAARSAGFFGSEEALEGMKAFAEKRPPKWQEGLV